MGFLRAFEGRFSLNRSGYGLSRHVDGGSGLIGNEVEITLLVEGLKLGPDGQVPNVKTQPAASQPAAQPARKPGIEDLLKDILR